MVNGAGHREVLPQLLGLPPSCFRGPDFPGPRSGSPLRPGRYPSGGAQRSLPALLDAGPLRLKGDRAGEVATVIVDGVDALEGYYSRYLPHLAVMAMVPLSILAAVVPVRLNPGRDHAVHCSFHPFFHHPYRPRRKASISASGKPWPASGAISSTGLTACHLAHVQRLAPRSRDDRPHLGRLPPATMSVLYMAFLSALVLEFFATASVALMAVISAFGS